PLSGVIWLSTLSATSRMVLAMPSPSALPLPMASTGTGSLCCFRCSFCARRNTSPRNREAACRQIALLRREVDSLSAPDAAERAGRSALSLPQIRQSVAEEFGRRYDCAGVARQIHVESRVHFAVRIIGRRVSHHGHVVSKLRGKANGRFEAGMGDQTDHDESLYPVPL